MLVISGISVGRWILEKVFFITRGYIFIYVWCFVPGLYPRAKYNSTFSQSVIQLFFRVVLGVLLLFV